MEALARRLLDSINRICIEYYHLKADDTVEKAVALKEEIQELVSGLLTALGEDGESADLRAYVLQALRDYADAAAQRDEALMIDTLDYGIRDILKLYIDE